LNCFTKRRNRNGRDTWSQFAQQPLFDLRSEHVALVPYFPVERVAARVAASHTFAWTVPLVPVIEPLAVSVAVTVWRPRFLKVTEKVWVPLSAADQSRRLVVSERVP
jgi:hypothetical protein